MGFDSSHSAEDEDEESVDASVEYGESQEVSIHKLQLQKFGGDLSESGIIDVIVTKYNQAGQNGNTQRTSREKYPFVESKVLNLPAIREEDQDLFNGEEYAVRVLTQTVQKRIGLLSAFGISKSTTIIHNLIFYHRPGEIFALTTGQAWHCIQWCSDYDFPAQIAARLLSEEGQLETNNKGLVGNQVSSRRTRKAHEQKNPFEILELCTSFSAKLRNNCSLRNFLAFKSHPDAKISVTLAAIRFKKRLDAADFPVILSHFSVISKGERTFVYAGPRADLNRPSTSNVPSSPAQAEPIQEKDTHAHLNSLTRVSTDSSKCLDTLLSSLICEALLQNPPNFPQGQMSSFAICHKHYEEFYSARVVNLHYKGQIIKVYHHVPSLDEILEELRGLNLRQIVNNRQLEKRKGRKTFDEEFLEELTKVRLSFEMENGKGKKAEKLFNFLEGAYWNEVDGRVYWHVLSQWCSVRDGYLFIVHQQFLDTVSKGIMDGSQEAFLQIPWPRRDLNDQDQADGIPFAEDEILNYVKLYINTQNWYAWMSPTANSSPVEGKLFDLMYIGEKKQIFLYYLTRTLDFKALTTSAKLTEATLSIKSAAMANGWASNTLLEIFQSNPSLEATFPNFEAFLSGISKARIVYAFGGERERLERESQLPIEIGIEYIERQLELAGGNARAQQAQAVYEALQKEGYLNRNGCITSKLLISTPYTFNLDSSLLGTLTSTNDFVYNQIVKHFQSGYNGIMLKLEFQRIKRCLNETALEFMLCPMAEEE